MKSKKISVAMIFAIAMITCVLVKGQNPKLKVYFNHPVNTANSSGTNAVYLNGKFADTIAAYINRAKHTIDIAQYDYSASSSSHIKMIATAANNALARGVVVRWIYNGSSPNSGLSLLNSSIHKLGSPTTSGYGIMHNKFMVVDANSSTASDAVVLVGSNDWSDNQCTGSYNNMVFIQDQNMAKAFYNEFNKMWGGTGASPNTTNSKFGTHKTASTVTSFTVGTTHIQVYFSPKDLTGTELTNSINSANHELFFGIYTFTDNTIANAIKTKHTAGITCKGIMDTYSSTYSPYTTLHSALGSNLKIYNGGSNLYHNKMIIVDYSYPTSDPQVCTGSFNWSSSAETSNDESLIIIHDATIANEYYQSLCKNFVDAGGAACASGARLSGVEEFDFGQDEATIFPNPFSDAEIITVRVKNAGEVLSVKITDQLGRLVKEEQINSAEELTVNVGDLPAGIYLAIINRGDKTFVRKILK